MGVWSVLSRFGVGLLMEREKTGGRVMKNKGRFWRAKASLFGRESVAAFLVGDLGCAYRDRDSADFRLDAACPAQHTIPFREGVVVVRLSSLSLPSCPKLSAGTHSQVVTR